jgi:hypothetical protein
MRMKPAVGVARRDRLDLNGRLRMRRGGFTSSFATLTPA